jgi:hypothetical protein
MRRFLFAAVYTLAALGANAAAADPARLAPLLEGDMRKLVLHAEPRTGWATGGARCWW